MPADGNRIDLDGIAAARALKNKQPGTLGELRANFGLLSYYWQCIKDFSCIASPLLKEPVKSETLQNKKRRWQTKQQRSSNC